MSTVTDLALVDEADRIICEAEETRHQWPSSREARAAIGHARACASDAMCLHAQLVHGDLDPEEAGAPQAGPDEDPEQAAIRWAGEMALDAAKALQARIGEYQRREDAARAGGTEGGSSE